MQVTRIHMFSPMLRAIHLSDSSNISMYFYPHWRKLEVGSLALPHKNTLHERISLFYLISHFMCRFHQCLSLHISLSSILLLLPVMIDSITWEARGKYYQLDDFTSTIKWFPFNKSSLSTIKLHSQSLISLGNIPF